MPSVIAKRRDAQQVKENGEMIEAHGLTKRYGDKLAVDDLTFTVRPGVVTGFLGPNGAGKSTTMRLILGLDAPTSGTVTVNGKPYRRLDAPLREVGALLEARSVHPGRSARNHLLAIAQTCGIRRSRVDEVIEAVNGLDTEGIRWIRSLLRGLAAEGRTVFVSSHLMSEMALTAEHLIVIGRGRLIADAGVEEFIAGTARDTVRVRTTDSDGLSILLRAPDVTVACDQDGVLTVSGLTTDRVGTIAGAAGITLLELTAQQASLEEAFIDMTSDAVEYRAPTADQ
jgi:ABC-2 type transport system ATP-binding protein